MISDEFFFEAEILSRVDHPHIVHGMCDFVGCFLILPLLILPFYPLHIFNHHFSIIISLSSFSVYTASGSGSDPLPFLVLEELKPLPQFFNLQGPEASVFDFTTVIGFAKELSSAMLYLHEGIPRSPYQLLSSLHPINPYHHYTLSTINSPSDIPLLTFFLSTTDIDGTNFIQKCSLTEWSSIET